MIGKTRRGGCVTSLLLLLANIMVALEGNDEIMWPMAQLAISCPKFLYSMIVEYTVFSCRGDLVI